MGGPWGVRSGVADRYFSALSKTASFVAIGDEIGDSPRLGDCCEVALCCAAGVIADEAGASAMLIRGWEVELQVNRCLFALLPGVVFCAGEASEGVASDGIKAFMAAKRVQFCCVRASIIFVWAWTAASSRSITAIRALVVSVAGGAAAWLTARAYDPAVRGIGSGGLEAVGGRERVAGLLACFSLITAAARLIPFSVRNRWMVISFFHVGQSGEVTGWSPPQAAH